jgi:AcrR family transcriptional regulator
VSDLPKPADDGKRAALLDAARELFLKNTYSNISIRKIADKAKVNSAMIAYYFGSKNGLFREMVKSYIESNIDRMKANIHHVGKVELNDFFSNFYRTVPSELTHLIIRTMIFERSDMRSWLLESLMKPTFDTAMQAATAIVDHKGKPVDPLIVRTTLQGMLIVPKLIQPILEELHPDEINDEYYERLAEFQSDLIANYFELETNR